MYRVFLLLVLVISFIGLFSITPYAYADHNAPSEPETEPESESEPGTETEPEPPQYPAPNPNADVTLTQASGVPGCENDNNCYDPYEITVDQGATVTWYNADTAAHTVTSGSLQTNPGGVGNDFDSSLFMSGSTYSHTFDNAGEFLYFCQVHPWMVGTVTVVGSDLVSEPTPKIPEWVKNIFIWYAEDRISDEELIGALQFLIDEGILKV